MAPDEHLLYLLLEVGVSVTMPYFSNWVAAAAAAAPPAAVYWGSGWALSHIAVDGISWFTCTMSVIGPGYHPFISVSSLGWPVRASFLLLSLFVPVLPFAFLVYVSFCFLCVAFVFLSSSPLLVGWFLCFQVLGILGSLLPSPVLGLQLALCVLPGSVA